VRYELNMNTYLYIYIYISGQFLFSNVMPWIGRFVSGLSSWKVRVRSRVSPAFCGRQSGTVEVPPSRVLRLSSVSTIALMLHTHLHLNADF